MFTLLFPNRRNLWRAAVRRAVTCVILVATANAAVHGQAESAREIEPGVSWYETTQSTAINSETTLWVYLPTGATGKIPCVVIAPAGTPLIYGSSLGEEERPEHLPYVRAGFAVVAYSIDGDLPENHTDEDILSGFTAFRAAHAGVTDTYAAVDYIRAHLPQVDPKRIYVAGHSSAGTLALLAAESDRRIAACVAYAPVCDVPKRQAKLIPIMEQYVPDIRGFFSRTSPSTNAAKLRCPLFLFHADDDGNVPTGEVAAFARKVSRTNTHVTFSRAQRGGHYQSMIDPGIQRAIAWLKKLP